MSGDAELLVLGSGGPFANPTRAFSSFVLLEDGVPVVLATVETARAEGFAASRATSG